MAPPKVDKGRKAGHNTPPTGVRPKAPPAAPPPPAPISGSTVTLVNELYQILALLRDPHVIDPFARKEAKERLAKLLNA